MCMPGLAVPLLSLAVGTGLQYAGWKANQNATRNAADARMGYLNQASNFGYDNTNRNAALITGQNQQYFTPQAMQQRTDSEAARIAGSVNKNILEANLAFGDTSTPGKTSDEYQRNYAGYLADEAERTSRMVDNYAQLAAPGFVDLESRGILARTGSTMAVGGANTANKAQIASNTAGLVQPDYPLGAALASGVGGAVTSAALGNIMTGLKAPTAGAPTPGGNAGWNINVQGNAIPWAGTPYQLPPVYNIPYAR